MTSDRCSCYGTCNHDKVEPPTITVQSADGGFHPPDEPQLDHLIRDLWDAVEEECFEVETPRVHVEQDGFDSLSISKTFGEPTIGQLRSARGPPMVELKVEWHTENSDLMHDLHAHTQDASEVVLYGRQHLWQVERPWDFDMTCHTEFGGGFAEKEVLVCDAKMSWREFEEIGWR